ncbi:MAG: hypothetical protein ACK486_16995, partial [Cyanobacteriota bacterium]
MGLPFRSGAVLGPLLALPLLLAGCSGTPFGEALSRSFPPGGGEPQPGSSPESSQGSSPGTTSSAARPTPATDSPSPGGGPTTSPATPTPAAGIGTAKGTTAATGAS